MSSPVSLPIASNGELIAIDSELEAARGLALEEIAASTRDCYRRDGRLFASGARRGTCHPCQPRRLPLPHISPIWWIAGSGRPPSAEDWLQSATCTASPVPTPPFQIGGQRATATKLFYQPQQSPLLLVQAAQHPPQCTPPAILPHEAHVWGKSGF